MVLAVLARTFPSALIEGLLLTNRNLTARLGPTVVIISDIITSTNSGGRSRNGKTLTLHAEGKVIVDVLKGSVGATMISSSTAVFSCDLPPSTQLIAFSKALCFIAMGGSKVKSYLRLVGAPKATRRS